MQSQDSLLHTRQVLLQLRSEAIKVFATLLIAAIMISAWSATELRIEGYDFSCKTPHGERLKPKFCDIDGFC